MDYGALGDYFKLVLAKNLSNVDINSKISNQHELGGFVKFRPILGDGTRRRIPATYVYMDDDKIKYENSWTSWYDSRKDNPNRGPEYRLYYPDVEPIRMAHPGDLTVAAITKDDTMLFLFVDVYSKCNSDVTYLFGLEEYSDRNKPPRSMQRRIDAIGASILEILGIEVNKPRHVEDYVDQMIQEWPDKFPSGRDFAEFARWVSECDPLEDPDRALVDYYNTQTVLFMEYERYEHVTRLGPLVTNVDDPDYNAILRVAMSLFQRRRSAAGHALEYHLEAIFDAYNISYTAQCRTERRERPDFVFPSYRAYHDNWFPEEGLTLLGAKTTAKDRWRQILQEGDRVRTKHLITLEPSISIEQTNEMHERSLQLVIPEPIRASYLKTQLNEIWNLRDFIDYVGRKQEAFC